MQFINYFLFSILIICFFFYYFNLFFYFFGFPLFFWFIFFNINFLQNFLDFHMTGFKRIPFFTFFIKLQLIWRKFRYICSIFKYFVFVFDHNIVIMLATICCNMFYLIGWQFFKLFQSFFLLSLTLIRFFQNFQFFNCFL